MKICHAFWGESKDLQLSKKLQGRVIFASSIMTSDLGPITVGDVPINERPITVNTLPDWRGNGFQHSIHHALMLAMWLKDIGREAEHIAERIVLEEEQGNLQRAAQRLGVTDRALQLRRAARKQQGNGKEISH